MNRFIFVVLLASTFFLVWGLGTASTTGAYATAGSSLTLSANSWSTGPVANSKSISVYTTSDISSWKATTDGSSWVTCTNYGSTFTVSVTANPGTSARSATITVTGGSQTKKFTVKQMGVNTQNNALSLSDLSWAAPLAGGSKTIVVVTSAADWSADSNVSWLSCGEYDGDLIISAQKNTGKTARTGTITVDAGRASEEIKVTQEGSVNFSLSADSWSASASAGSKVVTVTTNQSSWSASTNAISWLTCTTSGNQLTIKVTANTGAALRTGTITVKSGGLSQTITVAQTVAPSKASLSLSSDSWSPTAYSSSKNFTITTNQSSWSASASRYAWMTCTQSGNTLTVKTEKFNGSGSRTGIITVSAGDLCKTLTVTQAATETLSVSATSWSAPSAKNNSTVITVTTTQDNWSAKSDTSWLHCSKVNNKLTLQALSSNTAVAPRTGTITVKAGSMSKTITVTQAGTATLSVASESWSAPASDSSKTVKVTTNQSSWSASSSDTGWLKTSKSGSTLTINAVANTSADSRSGTITVKVGGLTEIITVTQKGATATLSFSPASWSSAAVSGSKVVTVTSNYSDWSVSYSDVDWLTYSVSGNKLTLKVVKNPGTSSRSGKITLAAGSVTKTITVTQAGATATLSFSASGWSTGATGGSTTVTVTTNHSSWSATSSAAWLTCTKSGDKLTLKAVANTEPETRTGKITVTAGSTTKTITVTQAGITPTLSVSDSSWTAADSGDSKVFTITTNLSSWSATSNAAWLTCTQSGNKLTVTAAANTNVTDGRTGTIIVTAGSLSQVITVAQASKATLSVSDSAWSASAARSSKSFTVNTNQSSWSASSSSTGWLACSKSGNQLTVTVAENIKTIERTGTVTITAGDLRETLTVTQKGASITLAISDSSWSVAVDGGSKAFGVTTNHDSWTASSNVTWLTCTQSGSTLNVTATANTNTTTRTGTITVTAGGVSKTIKVTQDKVPAPSSNATLSVSATSWAAAVSGSSQVFIISTNQSSWAVSSNVSWLTLSKNGTDLTVTAAANTDTSARYGRVTITAGDKIAIIQVTQASSSSSSSAELALSSTIWEPNFSAGNLIITVTTNQSSWTASSNATWLTYSQFGNTLNVIVAQNTGTASRTGAITVKAGSLSQSITVTQAGTATATLSVSESNWFPPASATNNSTTVTVTTNQSTWSATSSNTTWLNVSASGNKLTISVTENTGTNTRTGTVTVKAGNASKTITVTQNGASVSGGTTGPTLSVFPASWTAAQGGERTTVTVTTNQSSWTVSSNVSWLTYSKSGSQLTVTASANTDTAARIGIITIKAGGVSKSLTVTQSGEQVTLSLLTENWYPMASASDIGFSVTTNQSTWTAIPKADWLTCSKNGNLLIIYATANTGIAERTGTVSVTAGGLTKTVTVTQAGTETLVVGYDKWSAPAAGGNMSTAVTTSKGSWSVSTDASWLTCSRSQNGNTLNVTAKANTSGGVRSGIVFIKAGEFEHRIVVSQESTYENVVYDRESRHFIVEIPDSHLHENITPANLSRWLKHMDDAYDAYVGLVGGDPYPNKKVSIETSAEWPFYGWSQHWDATIVIHSDNAAEEMKRINDHDDWSFWGLHELSHLFEIGDGRWGFDDEFWANFKMVYVLETLPGANVFQNGTYTGNTIASYYQSASDMSYDATLGLASPVYHNDGLTYQFILIKNQIGGWDAFQQVFREYMTIPVSEIPASNTDKFLLYRDIFDAQSGLSLQAHFSDAQWQAILSGLG